MIIVAKTQQPIVQNCEQIKSRNILVRAQRRKKESTKIIYCRCRQKAGFVRKKNIFMYAAESTTKKIYYIELLF
jgi:hypothetical protein